MKNQNLQRLQCEGMMDKTKWSTWVLDRLLASILGLWYRYDWYRSRICTYLSLFPRDVRNFFELWYGKRYRMYGTLVVYSSTVALEQFYQICCRWIVYVSYRRVWKSTVRLFCHHPIISTYSKHITANYCKLLHAVVVKRENIKQFARYLCAQYKKLFSSTYVRALHIISSLVPSLVNISTRVVVKV